MSKTRGGKRKGSGRKKGSGKGRREMSERFTPETDALDCELHNPRVMQDSYSEMRDHAQQLERVNEAQKELSSIHRWIERNNADGFIDSLTYLQNLERVTDNWYDRIDAIETDALQANDEAEKIKIERKKAQESLKHITEYGTEEINAAVELRQKLASALVERDEARDKYTTLLTDNMLDVHKLYKAIELIKSLINQIERSAYGVDEAVSKMFLMEEAKKFANEMQ